MATPLTARDKLRKLTGPLLLRVCEFLPVAVTATI